MPGTRTRAPAPLLRSFGAAGICPVGGRQGRAVGGPAIDAIDLRILSEIERDGRQPVQEIAKKLGISRTTASAKLKRLLEEEVARIVTIVGPIGAQELHIRRDGPESLAKGSRYSRGESEGSAPGILAGEGGGRVRRDCGNHQPRLSRTCCSSWRSRWHRCRASSPWRRWLGSRSRRHPMNTWPPRI